MHKNPFNPPPTYPQPPLPPGPPPGQPPAQDYNGYWAQQQQQAGGTYPSQWNPVPPRSAPPPPSDQNHLFANYGYGPQWQRQNHQTQPPQYPHPPLPPPSQPPYTPYQPTAGYGQPFPPPHPPPHPAPGPQYQPLPPQPHIPPGPYFAPPPQNRLHHAPPSAQGPPAKRQRFDSGASQPQRQGQFQNQRGGGGGGGSQGNNRSTQNSNSGGAGRGGGMSGNRGGGRAGQGQNRGGMANKNGRGGGASFLGSGRGGSGGNHGQHSNSSGVRNHGSRNNVNNTNRRSGGGSFSARGRGSKGALGGGVSFGRHGPMNSSFGSLNGSKKDENRRTLTDFKLTTLDIPQLQWRWGMSSPDTSTLVVDATASERSAESSGDASVKMEQDDVRIGSTPPANDDAGAASSAQEPSSVRTLARTDTVIVKDGIPPPRMRIYFHTPVSPDDAQLLPSSDHVSDSRKGKRKKVDDDTDSIEDDRPPPPPPQPSADDRASMAASVAPSATSEGDWLMAAIADDSQSNQSDEHPDDEGAPQFDEHEHPVKTEDDSDLFSSSQPLSQSSFSSIEDYPAHGGDMTSATADSSENTNENRDPAPQNAAEATQTESGLFTANNLDHSTADDDDDDDDSHSVKTEPASPAPGQMDLDSQPSFYGPIHPDHVTQKVPSANRLSISYAGGSRRLVIDSEVVESMTIYRAEGRIDVVLTLSKDGDDDIRGILVENLSDETKSYSALHAITNVSHENDATFPPFSKVGSYPATITLVVRLDTVRPLSEPKWLKSGDIHEWLKSIFGRMFWVAGDAAQGWEKKIVVTDPDPAPTIRSVLDGWAVNSPVGAKTERERFLKTHMDDSENVMEILLRLVRGDRSMPFSANANQSLSLTNLSGPLLTALRPNAAHSAQQTHVSLAVLAMFQMAVDFAKEARHEHGLKDAQEKMGEIIRCLPSHLLYKSLDGIFKEWKVERKGGR